MRAQFGREWLEEQYCEKHRTLRDMGRECNVSGETIRAALKEFGIKYIPTWKRIDVERVRELVERRRKSYRATARELGTTHPTISKICQENGILHRKASEEEKRARCNARRNERYKSDPELRAKKIAVATQWVKDHPEQYRETRRKYRETHREKMAQYQHEWRRRHPDKANAYDRSRREAKKAAAAQALKTKGGYPTCITCEDPME